MRDALALLAITWILVLFVMASIVVLVHMQVFFHGFGRGPHVLVMVLVLVQTIIL